MRDGANVAQYAIEQRTATTGARTALIERFPSRSDGSMALWHPACRARVPRSWGLMFFRITNLFKAFLNLFVGSIERQNPEGAAGAGEEGISASRSPTSTEGLATHAGLAERLMGQVRKLERRPEGSARQGRRQPEGRQQGRR